VVRSDVYCAPPRKTSALYLILPEPRKSILR
jgi:hypothetical protein